MQFVDDKKTYEIEFVKIDGVLKPEAKFVLRATTPALGAVEFGIENIKEHKGVTVTLKCSLCGQTVIVRRGHQGE